MMDVLRCGRVALLAAATWTVGGAVQVCPGARVATVRAESAFDLQATGIFAGIERPEEQEAWLRLQQNRPIEARELAEEVLRGAPDAFVAHFIVAHVLHYNEADLPKAMFHGRKALSSFEARYTDTPKPTSPWAWHARILRELGAVAGELEDHEARLAYIARYNDLYDPDLIAEQAWTLMKLRRLPEARLAAGRGLASSDVTQQEIAHNALCAIEFEAGNDALSYEACTRALNFSREELGFVSTVDLTNTAEAARSLFRLNEAKALLLEATEAAPSWYGNPWLELGSLYLRQAHYQSALEAFAEMPGYRAKRPPHVRNADQAEIWRGLGELLLLGGRPEVAESLLGQAAALPDRRGHNSRDAAQDRIVVQLLRRSALLSQAVAVRRQAVGEPWWRRLGAFFQSKWLGFRGWYAGRAAGQWLLEGNRLVGLLRVGSAGSAITPPWVLGDLIDVVGSEAFLRAVAVARVEDSRPAAEAYYDAFAAEARLARGEQAAVTQLDAALAGLPESERLLRARLHAWRIRVGVDAGESRAILLRDAPALMPLQRVELRVALEPGALDGAPKLRRDLGRVPGLRLSERAAERLRIEASDAAVEGCLTASSGETLTCFATSRQAYDEARALGTTSASSFDAWAAKVVADALFSPGIDLSDAIVQRLDDTGGRTTPGPNDPLPALPGL